MFAAIEADREALGWARVARPGACYWCAMQATRGAVFETEESASFKPHNDCHCTVEPLFGRHYEPPAHVRGWQALYKESTDGEADKLNAFRRAYEGRTGGPRRGSSGGGVKDSVGQQLGFEHLTPDQLRNQVRILESLKDSDYKRKQLARYRKRLAELAK
jgi:hypothetical protein